MPAVSIITALHNKGPYIAETIRSVLAQTLFDWELIVVENGSTDDGPRSVASFSDERIRLVISPKVGPGAARNHGLQLARGDWVLFLDADDLIAPDYLKERLDHREQAPSVDLIAGPWTEFDDANPASAAIREPLAFEGSLADLRSAAVVCAPWALHAALVRRSLVSPGFTWPEELDRWPSEDTAFWFPLVMKARLVWARGHGAAYRLHTPSSRDERNDLERRTLGLVKIIDRNFAQLAGQRTAPSAGQCATAVRALERAWLECRKADRPVPARQAFDAATRYLTRGPSHGIGLQLRRLLGLRLFNRLRHLLA